MRRRRWTWGRTGSPDLPWLGASLIRTLRGMNVFKNVCWMHPSHLCEHVPRQRGPRIELRHQYAATSSLGLRRERTSWWCVEQMAKASSAKYSHCVGMSMLVPLSAH